MPATRTVRLCCTEYLYIDYIQIELLNTVAREMLGGKRILVMKINAQHNALSKAL